MKVDLRRNVVPTHGQQMQELLEEVFHQEHRHRRGFIAIDGVSEYRDHVHRCALPAAIGVRHQVHTCEGCQRTWVSEWCRAHWVLRD